MSILLTKPNLVKSKNILLNSVYPMSSKVNVCELNRLIDEVPTASVTLIGLKIEI